MVVVPEKEICEVSSIFCEHFECGYPHHSSHLRHSTKSLKDYISIFVIMIGVVVVRIVCMYHSIFMIAFF